MSRRKKSQRRSNPVTISSIFPDYTKKKYKAVAESKRAQFVQELRDAYRHRGLVLYVGAGVSRSLGLPSWPELIKLLTVRMMSQKVNTAIAALGDLKDESRWQAFWSIQEQFERVDTQDKPILMMARAIKNALGDSLPNQVAIELYRRYRGLHAFRRMRLGKEPAYELGQPIQTGLSSSDFLDALVAIARSERHFQGVNAIVNYNYDDILDENLREQNVHCLTIRSGKDRVPEGFLPCYHVHGVLPVQKFISLRRGFARNPYSPSVIGNFVFSEDEYHAEYSDPYKWSNMTQVSLLSRYTGLFVGLSLEDPNIRRLLDVTHKQYPEISNYAILLRKRSLSRSHESKQGVLFNLFEEVETSSFQSIGVKVIWVDSFAEIPDVISQMCVLESYDAANAS